MYNEILNHANTSDELRRATESKLLRHKRLYLSALPASGEKADEKKKLATEVQDLVNGMVLLRIPDELAWTIFIDGKNSETVGAMAFLVRPLSSLTSSAEDYNFSILRQFVELFPSAALARLIRGYLLYMGLPLTEDEDNLEEPAGSPPENEDPFDLMLVCMARLRSADSCLTILQEAFGGLSTSILAHRILAEVYLWDLDYQNAISVAEVGIDLARRQRQDTGSDIPL